MNSINKNVVVTFSKPITYGIEESLSAFTLQINEPLFVGGTPYTKELKFDRVAVYENDTNALLLSIDSNTDFGNANRTARLIYDSSIGSLGNAVGMVDSFDIEFNLTDLVNTLQPGHAERFRSTRNCKVSMCPIVSTNERPYNDKDVVVTVLPTAKCSTNMTYISSKYISPYNAKDVVIVQTVLCTCTAVGTKITSNYP